MKYAIAEPFNSQLIAVILLLATSLSCYGEDGRKIKSTLIEVFTASQYSVHGQIIQRLTERGKGEYKLYVIDRIDQLQQTLSRDLASDPDIARQKALKRFQSMDSDLSQALENAAKGLAKAMQYDIDRYPAIVFDGEAVIYGVIDLDVAINYYRRWQSQVN